MKRRKEVVIDLFSTKLCPSKGGPAHTTSQWGLLKRRIEGIEEAVGITGVEGRSYCSRTRLVLLEYALFSFLAGERSI
ncbi:UNVERIFIED_CONTAM: hypothetical protein Slati_4564500 [Sesamum latifolium]|uniref:Uncharacterized protein n=1 Tax=Sesamum latifolium TaxID=2727402 RepID=A0AAW2SI86_9LAMI